MLFKNNYCEIVDENFNSLIIQKSKFISYAFKVYDLNQVKRKLDLLKKNIKKLTTTAMLMFYHSTHQYKRARMMESQVLLQVNLFLIKLK